MAEIDAEELERCLLLLDELEFNLPWSQLEALGVVEDAARAHLASLRAPKGELEEARAELGAWLVEHPYTSASGPVLSGLVEDGQVVLRVFRHQQTLAVGRGPTEAAAIRAALSRARGEGT